MPGAASEDAGGYELLASSPDAAVVLERKPARLEYEVSRLLGWVAREGLGCGREIVPIFFLQLKRPVLWLVVGAHHPQLPRASLFWCCKRGLLPLAISLCLHSCLLSVRATAPTVAAATTPAFPCRCC